MKVKVFSIFDEKARIFSNPFFMPHAGEALRSFGDLVQDKSSRIAKHPEDYKLYHLAEYDDCSGSFVSLNVPVFLANATEFVVEE